MLERVLLLEVSHPFALSLAALDLRAVQRAFSALMDEAAAGVQARGLDADDVLLERFAALAHPAAAGQSWELLEPSLTDAASWSKALAGLARGAPAGESPAAACTTRLGIRVYREKGIPLPDFGENQPQ